MPRALASYHLGGDFAEIIRRDNRRTMAHIVATVLAGAAFTRGPLLRPPDPGLRAGVVFERAPHSLPPLQCRRANLVGAEASAAPDVVVEAWIARSAAVVVAAISGRMSAARPLITLLRWLALISFVAVAPVSFLECGVTAVVLILSGAAGYFPFNVVTGTLGSDAIAHLTAPQIAQARASPQASPASSPCCTSAPSGGGASSSHVAWRRRRRRRRAPARSATRACSRSSSRRSRRRSRGRYRANARGRGAG